MLLLKKLEVEGFGPFAERQLLEFPAEPGITLVYGENMRGKTSLLNAVRYAFYGQVLGRGSRRRKLHSISNRALAANGQYGFKVRLSFVNDGEEYELVRTCRPLPGRVPKGDEDYEQDVKLRHGATILGPGERDAVLSRVLPDQISRFFLFDGELLQEYEKLLFEDDDEGRKISEAIERILGVPILKQARAHLADLADEANSAEAKEASRSKETVAIGNALKLATDRKKFHRDEIARLESELEDLIAEKTEAENYLKSQQKFLTIINERDQADAQLKKLKAEMESDTADLKVAMADAWRTLLVGPVQAAREKATLEAKKVIDRMAMQLRQQAIDEGQCGTCAQTIDSATAEQLRLTLPDSADASSGRATEDLSDLNRFKDRDVSAIVAQLSSRLAAARGEIAQLKDQLKDKQTELADADVERLEGDNTSLADTMKKIVITETALTGHHEKVVESDASIKKLKGKLAKTAPANLRASQIRSELLEQATEVFACAIERYKADLRGKVQETASKLFLSMTTEKSDYIGLEITQTYGLNLIHSDASVEEGRSAGAEHVIALALIGALQANAPMRGPIVMDSPFGRLDEGHTENVIATLPTMATQVVLFVHSAELHKNSVREVLGSKLVREYQLVRVSSRRTRIDLVK